MKPITLLIGHRGVGKTTVIENLKAMGFRALDLDHEIELLSGESVAELFKKGEDHFRKIERETLIRLVEQVSEPTWISLGAGYVGDLPQKCRVVWIQRVTDSKGRIFLNRPRLNPDLSPLDEYNFRRKERDLRFSNWATDELIVPEGYSRGLESFLTEGPLNIPYDLTLLPIHFKNFEKFVAVRKNWGIRRLELRSDWLSADQIEMVVKNWPSTQLLFSSRANDHVPPPDIPVDWALDLGQSSFPVDIVSLHERSTSLKDSFDRLAEGRRVTVSRTGNPIVEKLAVPIASWDELMLGHKWWLKSPGTRAFLPRSADGRWQWYRNLFGRKMPIHFFREGQGSALDQPDLFSTLHSPELTRGFAAVLGDPISHSRSPQEQFEFFRNYRMPMVAIRVADNEWSVAISALESLGLRCAAVTSPLKIKAQTWVGADQPINTLWLDNQTWRGANTDLPALKAWANEFVNLKNPVLWGRGAMSENVKAVLPHIQALSAREGVQSLPDCELLIWSAARSREFKWPPETPELKMILDLNYTEDSPGLELALLRKIPYQSGLNLLKLQGELQRAHWSKILEAET